MESKTIQENIFDKSRILASSEQKLVEIPICDYCDRSKELVVGLACFRWYCMECEI
jgi:hypothetical protein